MMDDNNLSAILNIANGVNENNIGDSFERVVVIQAAIQDLVIGEKSEEVVEHLRKYARNASIGWKIFSEPILPTKKLNDEQKWQIFGIVITLQELVYCFESVVRGAELTWSRSDPVRFYVNGIFHYLCALFLLDWKRNKEKGLSRAGTIIKVLDPIDLDQLVSRIYEIFDRKFGEKYSYGETIRRIRNKHIVHGSFSPTNVKDLVNDNKIFSVMRQVRFVSNHYDLYNQIILLRLRLVSILSAFEVDPSTYSAETLYGV